MALRVFHPNDIFVRPFDLYVMQTDSGIELQPGLVLSHPVKVIEQNDEGEIIERGGPTEGLRFKRYEAPATVGVVTALGPNVHDVAVGDTILFLPHSILGCWHVGDGEYAMNIEDVLCVFPGDVLLDTYTGD